MKLNSVSKLLLNFKNYFLKKKVLFSGNIQDSLPEILKTKNSGIHIQKYNFLKYIKNITKKKIFINFLMKKKIIKNYNTIIYFFSKNKKESYFQLKNIISIVKKETSIFLVGENKSGINSFIKFFKKEILFKKLSYGKKCVIYLTILKNNVSFNLKNFYKIHYWKKIPIKFLPGVFGYKKIDKGSKLLVSTFYSKLISNKKILDMGSGSGFLSIVILKLNENNKITLSDSCLKSIKCCKENFKLNKLKGVFKKSDLYSNIYKKFNLIISNPPVHDNLKKSFSFLTKFIYKSIFYLKKNGELRLVINKSFSYSKNIRNIFKKFNILKENKNFIVYQIFIKNLKEIFLNKIYPKRDSNPQSYK
ncbi:Ribosomal RNA small subunit methyltransferase C [Buchnera aphidicola (Periphyllus testudinaceus)]|uniref:methyltransferase n=1 Tax=Buchnera aphidicola TaxID=9 RepID=UPI00346475B4